MEPRSSVRRLCIANRLYDTGRTSLPHSNRYNREPWVQRCTLLTEANGCDGYPSSTSSVPDCQQQGNQLPGLHSMLASMLLMPLIVILWVAWKRFMEFIDFSMYISHHHCGLAKICGVDCYALVACGCPSHFVHHVCTDSKRVSATSHSILAQPGWANHGDAAFTQVSACASLGMARSSI